MCVRELHGAEQGVLVPPELTEDPLSAVLRGHPCLCSLIWL